MAKMSIIKRINADHGKKRHNHEFEIVFHFEGELINDMVGGIDVNLINAKMENVLDELTDSYIDEVINKRGIVENIAVYLLNKLADVENLYSITVSGGAIEKRVEVFKSEVIK